MAACAINKMINQMDCEDIIIIDLADEPAGEAAGGEPEEAASAANKMIKFSCVQQMKNDIRDAGAIYPLVSWISLGPSCEVAQYSLAVLQNISRGSPANRDEIRIAGGIQPLIDILCEHPLVPKSAGGTGSDKDRASRISMSEEGVALPPDEVMPWRNNDDFQEAEEILAGTALEAAEVLEEIAVSNSTNSAEICKLGGVPPLVALLKMASLRPCKATNVSLNALVNFTNSSEACDRLAECGATAIMLEIIESSASKLQVALALEGVAQMARLSLACRTVIVERGGAAQMLSLLEWSSSRAFQIYSKDLAQVALARSGSSEEAHLSL